MAANKSVEGAKVHGGTQTKVPIWKPVVMQAKHATPCSYCSLPISPGNAIYPWVRDVHSQHFSTCKLACLSHNTSQPILLAAMLQGNYTGYMHLSCALKEADEQNIELLPPVCSYLHCLHTASSPHVMCIECDDATQCCIA